MLTSNANQNGQCNRTLFNLATPQSSRIFPVRENDTVVLFGAAGSTITGSASNGSTTVVFTPALSNAASSIPPFVGASASITIPYTDIVDETVIEFNDFSLPYIQPVGITETDGVYNITTAGIYNINANFTSDSGREDSQIRLEHAANGSDTFNVVDGTQIAVTDPLSRNYSISVLLNLEAGDEIRFVAETGAATSSETFDITNGNFSILLSHPL